MLYLKNFKTDFLFSSETPLEGILIGEDDCIADIDPKEIPEDCTVLNLNGCYLSAGWVDLHTHIYDGVTDIALDPDLIGPVQGVTALCDAGSSGAITFPGFRDYVIKKHPYHIYSFLNIGVAGIIRTNIIGDVETDDFLMREATLECIKNNRQHIKGIKLRACYVALKNRRGIDIVKQTCSIAEEAGLPVMVHIGEGPPMLKEILDVLRKGDIITHCFHGKPGGVIQEGKILPEVYKAIERGVLFDIGHGSASFDSNVAKQAISEGIKPHTISTDLHNRSINTPVHSLAVTMAKMVYCGLTPHEVVLAVTESPSEILGIESYRSGLKGKPARFTAFNVLKDNIRGFSDSMGNRLRLGTHFQPRYAIMGTEVVRSSSSENTPTEYK